MVKTFNQAERARKASVLLNKFIKGEIKLTEVEVSVYVQLIKMQSQCSFYFFAKYVLGFNLLTEQTHKKWADKLQTDFWKFDNLLRMKPRKTYKTTLYGEAFILWLWAVISPELHIMYTSANGSLLSEVSAHLDYYLTAGNSQLYTFVFGIERDLSIRPNTNDVINIVGKNKALKGSSLMFRTAGGSVNGVHPHIIIVDDPMDRLDRESATIRRKKERWFESLYPLLMEYDLDGISLSRLMVITTRWHLDDLANFIIKKNDDLDEEDRFDIEVESIYKPDGTPMYPEFFPESKIKKLRDKMSEVFFSCQELNNPLPEGLQVFDKKRLHFYEHLLFNIHEGEVKCLLDPSKGKQDSAYPAVIWVQYHNNKVKIFDAIDKKVMISDMLKLIAQKNILYNVPEILFEGNGTMLMKENIKHAHNAIDPNYSILIREINEDRNKQERINAMQPNLYNGSVLFRSDYENAYPELMNQVVFYPAWGPVDYPDIIEKAVSHFLRGKWRWTDEQLKDVATGVETVEDKKIAEVYKPESVSNEWAHLYDDIETNIFDYDFGYD